MKRKTVIYSGGISIAIFLILIHVFLAYALYPRVDVEGATQTLEAQGYTAITITGWRWLPPLVCDKNDWYHTGFEATASTGEKVTGIVCGGKYANTIHPD